MKMTEEQRKMNAIFRRHEQNEKDFASLPDAEQRYARTALWLLTRPRTCGGSPA